MLLVISLILIVFHFSFVLLLSLIGFDFFFDFTSPYSYLAHKQIRNIELQYNIGINYMPILLGGLLNLAEVPVPFVEP